MLAFEFDEIVGAIAREGDLRAGGSGEIARLGVGGCIAGLARADDFVCAVDHDVIIDAGIGGEIAVAHGHEFHAALG